jgi:glycosyltransferase involved in cell wall biosynthesis
MTPRLRVAVSSWQLAYPTELYRPLEGRVEVLAWPKDVWREPEELARLLPEADAVHLHWPELSFGLTQDRHREAAEVIGRTGLPLVWTAHDAAPHTSQSEEGASLYKAWSEHADAIIHHSRWGESEMRRLYCFKPSALHRVIYHPPWRRKYVSKNAGTREEAEQVLGLRPGKLRIGIHGGPRPAKDVQLALDAFAACERSDLELFVACLNGETVPNDDRIVACPYEYLPRSRFKLMLQAIDVVLLPFATGRSTLTTGLPADAIALGKPMIASDFPYFAEVLGDAAIVYGHTREDLTASLDRLDHVALAAATERTVALRERYTWKQAAADTLELLQEVLTA